MRPAAQSLFFACPKKRNQKKGTLLRWSACGRLPCAARVRQAAAELGRLGPASDSPRRPSAARSATCPPLRCSAAKKGTHSQSGSRNTSGAAARCGYVRFSRFPYAAPRSAGWRRLPERSEGPRGLFELRWPAGPKGRVPQRPSSPEHRREPGAAGRRIRVAFLWFLSLATQRKESRLPGRDPAQPHAVNRRSEPACQANAPSPYTSTLSINRVLPIRAAVSTTSGSSIACGACRSARRRIAT